MPDALRDSSSNDPSQENLDAVVNDKDVTPQLVVREFPPTEAPQAVPETNVNKANNNEPGKCFRCETASINFCRHCGQEFCAEHESRYSNGICYLCIASDNLGLEYVDIEDEEPDENGIMHKHRGRRIKLIGEGWPNAMQMIDTLNDEGLEVFIAERKRLLDEAVKLGEYHRITLAKAEFKKEYNRRSKIEKLRRRREELIQQGSLRFGGKVVNMSPKRQKTEDEKMAAQFGISLKEWMAVKVLLKAAK
jgi:hypothetical protein